MKLHKFWIEECHVARGIEREFGEPNALDYLIGEKFLNFLETADDDAQFRAELPAFVAEIKTIFKLEIVRVSRKARQTDPFDPTVYKDDDEIEFERQPELRRSAADLVLGEQAKDWLLGE